jgi:hypothetical protein
MITIPKEQMLCLLQNSEAKYVIVGTRHRIRANLRDQSSFSMETCNKILPTYSIIFCKGAKLLF